jgi:hypothetical protein
MLYNIILIYPDVINMKCDYCALLVFIDTTQCRHYFVNIIPQLWLSKVAMKTVFLFNAFINGHNYI